LEAGGFIKNQYCYFHLTFQQTGQYKSN